jgi:large subunit ribosomal protein L24
MSTPFRKAAHKLKKIARNAIPASSWNIYRGDRVVVTAGRDRGESGLVSRVDRDKSLVFVTGLNLVKKHVRGQGERPGQIVSVEAGLHYSKVALADPVSGAPVRVARMFLDDGTKVRVSRGALASGSVIPMPGEASGRKAPRATGKGAADTPTKEVLRETRDASNSDLFRGMREQDRTPAGEE